MSYFGAGCTTPLPAQTGGVERLLSLTVNGQVRRVDVLPGETLAMTLRYKLGLTGTKLGCDRAECGACTVLIDDVNHYSWFDAYASCARPPDHDRRGARESGRHAASGPTGVHRRARSAVRVLHTGPGDVGGRAAARESESDPTGGPRSYVRQLCRCGAYDHYLNSVMRAAGEV